MRTQKTNKLLAPIIIAGITVGFLVSAYKFVFKKHSSGQVTSANPADSTADIQYFES